MMFFAVSCGTKPVEFDPDFFEFMPTERGYIVNEEKTEKYYCDEPRIRTMFAALHINKVIELRKILRSATVPDHFKSKKKKFLGTIQKVINKAYK